MSRVFGGAFAFLAVFALLAGPGAADEHLPGLKGDPPGANWQSRPRPYPYPYPVTPVSVVPPASPPRSPWWELTEEERGAARGIAERYGQVQVALADRNHQVDVFPWHADEKIGAGVHFRYDRPHTIEADWPGAWPFGGRFRMGKVTELIAMVDLRRGEVAFLTCGPVCEREPDATGRTLRLLSPVLQVLFGGRH